MIDPCVARVAQHSALDVEPFVRFGLKYAGVLHRPPMDRMEQVVRAEVADLSARAAAAVQAQGPAIADGQAGREALAVLAAAVAGETFPRDALAALSARLRDTAAGSPSGVGQTSAALADVLDGYLGKHAALEARVGWLLEGTPATAIDGLDPAVDTDRIHHAVTNAFRFESRVLEMMAINRIAQSTTIGTFFRSTREAEGNPLFRFYDTYALYSNVFEWGLDSLRGRRAVERMNQIHGRYYIPNDEMKFVLVQGAFTWLDGADRIAHRRLTRVERQAMFLAWARMGRAMNIADITDDYGEMYAWYGEVCRASADHQPTKRDTYETIVRASTAGQPADLADGLLMASRVAMDDSYLSALGYERPGAAESQAVRAVFFTVGSFIEKLPYTPYLRTLQNNPARRVLTDPGELGTPERSRFMPVAVAGRPNAGFPEWQVPIRGAADGRQMELPEIAWDEVRAHTTAESLWTVIDGYVYDLTPMLRVHPGGEEVLLRWGGRDASRQFHAAPHTAGTLTFALNYRIGRVSPGRDGG